MMAQDQVIKVLEQNQRWMSAAEINAASKVTTACLSRQLLQLTKYKIIQRKTKRILFGQYKTGRNVYVYRLKNSHLNENNTRGV